MKTVIKNGWEVSSLLVAIQSVNFIIPNLGAVGSPITKMHPLRIWAALAQLPFQYLADKRIELSAIRGLGSYKSAIKFSYRHKKTLELSLSGWFILLNPDACIAYGVRSSASQIADLLKDRAHPSGLARYTCTSPFGRCFATSQTAVLPFGRTTGSHPIGCYKCKNHLKRWFWHLWRTHQDSNLRPLPPESLRFECDARYFKRYFYIGCLLISTVWVLILGWV